MSVQLNVYGVHDEVVGTLVLTVHDPNGQVAANGVRFYVTDGTGVRSAAQEADRRPSPGVYEKDVALSESNETLIEPEVTLTDGTKLTPGAQSFPRTTGMAITLVHGGGTERGTSLEIKSGLSVHRTGDGRRPVISASKSLLASAGQAGRGLREGDERSGLGGVPGGLRVGVPLVDREGLQELVDPATRRMGGSLLGPSGTSAGGIETGANTAASGLETSGPGYGKVRLGVPRAHARAELPALSATDGKLDPNQTMSGSSNYPIETGDSLTNLGDRSLAYIADDPTSDRRAATVSEKTGGAAAASGLNTAAGPNYGRVNRAVPLAHAAADMDAIDTASGRLDDGRPMLNPDPKTGLAAYPLGNGDSITTLDHRTLAHIADDPTLDRRAVTAAEKTGGSRAWNALDPNSRLVDSRRMVMISVANRESIQTGFVGPLVTASRSGSLVSISVQPHTLQLGVGIAYNSGTCSVISSKDGATIYVYTDDDNFGGNDVTYHATLNAVDIFASKARYFVGKAPTPPDGGSSGGGGGGGGGDGIQAL
ncbi:MAG TPA: hypothetical protein VGR37_09040 [Longimicrobiaceae bacterium]|nr:hypothetical protein [Longimicrobiaceae bacterium]